MAQKTEQGAIALTRSAATPQFVFSPRRLLRAVLGYTLLTAVAVAMATPTLWMLSTSLKKSGQVLTINLLTDLFAGLIQNHCQKLFQIIRLHLLID